MKLLLNGFSYFHLIKQWLLDITERENNKTDNIENLWDYDAEEKTN